MKRAFLLSMLLAAAPLPGFAQGAASAPLAGKLLITGSSTMAPMIGELAKRFRLAHPGVVITVEAGGSGRGVADARGCGEGLNRVRALARGARGDPRLRFRALSELSAV